MGQKFSIVRLLKNTTLALIRLPRRIPLVGEVLSLPWKFHKETLAEILPTMILSVMPFWLIPILLSLDMRNESQVLSLSINGISKGELLISMAALLSPVFYPLTRNMRGAKAQFPYGRLLIHTSIVIIIVCSCVFGYIRATEDFSTGFVLNENFAVALSGVFFLVSFFLVYCVTLFGNGLEADRELSDSQESDFVEDFKNQ